MTMISYGQDHEDVMLHRVFPGGVIGYYIDVGANDPVVDSVTKHFYERGWRGINIEPIPEMYERLRADRPRDINLNIGLANRGGRLTFYESPEKPGWSTFSAALAGEYRLGGLELREREIPVTTLARVCEDHLEGPVDFLKVDVEGFEREVLEGADFRRWRPRVVLVENASADRWEPILLGADYLPAACTAINRFYVRSEDRSLVPAFREPVSPRDDFVTYKQVRMIRDLNERTPLRADFGPGTLSLACWLHREAARYPRLRSAYKRLVRRAR
jgi:FkbM family methyltransferase